MLSKIRDNICLGDKEATEAELREAGVTVIEFVSKPTVAQLKIADKAGAEVFFVGLHTDKINRPHIKDIACHIPKYMTQSGEVIAIIGETGLMAAAYVVARAICELENKTVYEVFEEMKDLPGFEISKAYL
jgi:hypothetical protein